MFSFLISMPRYLKRIVLLLVDLLLVPLSLYCAFALRFGNEFPIERLEQSWPLFVVLTVLAVPVIMLTGLNRIKLIAFEMHDIRRGAISASSLMVLAVASSYVLDLQAPRSIPLIFGPVFLMIHISLRMIARGVLLEMSGRDTSRVPVAIYGAGSAGVQLLAALRQDFQMRPVVFADDNLTLQKMTISGLQVCSRSKLEKLITQGEVRRVLLAMPSISEAVRRRKVKELSDLNCEVHSLPSYSEIMVGGGLTANLRPVTPDMLLGRDKVDLDAPEVARAYAGRSVMVTGAGGSIGSELCRQILRCNPHRLVLFDHSEYALYSINRELSAVAESLGTSLVSRLGSVCDRHRVESVLEEADVDIVLHAAAYKHVPLVEDNEIEGVRNNVLGTHVVAEAARSAGAERFILVSTDKAVRPTNIMGASKRLAELVIQDLQSRTDNTKFAMVRFGNVLGSSGSVIPLFQEQIARGGPVTLTHHAITRYFMTIPEAARLVLLAGAYATGGDVFVLDMGKPVNIRDLACRMIELSGLKVRDESNPNGDISIETVGLRPGEKLFEELLIGNKTLPTPHQKILRAEETKLSEIEVAKVLQQIRLATDTDDANLVRKTIREHVDGYHHELAEVSKG